MALKYLYVPSGVQAGTAYGVLPNSADADFDDFSRGSAGSRVDENGLINTGLGLGSEEVVNGGFDSASNWNIINSSGASTQITGGYLRIQTDGAYTLVEQNNVMQSGKQYTLSYDVTESNEGSLVIEIDGGGSITLSLPTSVGSHTVDFTPQRTTLAFKRGLGALDIKIDNVSVREVTEVNTNVPRIDHTGGGCPSLLLEPTSTNKIVYSEDFTQQSDTTWILQNNPTIEPNVEISPTGSLNASYLKAPFSATSISPRINHKFGAASGQTYIGSVFVKKGNVDYMRILSTGATSNPVQAYYNVSNGTLGTTGNPDKAKIEDYGNGWYRLILKIEATNNTSGALFYIQLAKGDNNPASTFDGTEKNIIFGAQLENQAYATSYIPNYGTAAGVTRSADDAGGTGDLSNVINSSEGVLYVNVAALSSNGGGARRITLNDGTTSNRLIFQYSSTSNQINYYFVVGGTNQCSMSHTLSNATNYSKIALKYKENDFALWVDGTAVGVDNLGNTLSAGTLNSLNFDGATGNYPFYGNVKEIRVYDEVLSDTELQELTTL